MKLFISKLIGFFFIPLFFLGGIYLLTDPYHTLHNFSVDNCSPVNREYISTELFLQNYKKFKYNSFIFGSSKACAINTYKWKEYLPKSSSQYLFQAWSETITGIYQKVRFLEKQNVKIENVLILIDIPSSFSKVQKSHDAMLLKHFQLSGESKIYNQFFLFYAFLKPSEIFRGIREKIKKPQSELDFDSISNDYHMINRNNYKYKPVQNFSLDKKAFDNYIQKPMISNRLINEEFRIVLLEMKSIFVKHHTKVKVIITPDYSQIRINNDDFELLKSVFGESNVHNYSGKNSITNDKYNFMDVNHFDNIIGWQLLEDVYH